MNGGPDPRELLKAVAAKVRERLTGVATLPPVQAQRPASRPGHPRLMEVMESPFVQDTLRRTGLYRPDDRMYQMDYDPDMKPDRYAEARPMPIAFKPLRGFMGPQGLAEGAPPPELTVAHELAHVMKGNTFGDDLTAAVGSRFPEVEAKHDSLMANVEPAVDYYTDERNHPFDNPPPRPPRPTFDGRVTSRQEQFAYAVEAAFEVMRSGDDPRKLAEMDAMVPGTKEAYEILQQRLNPRPTLASKIRGMLPGGE